MTAVLFGWPYAGLVLAAGLLGWLFLERRPPAAPARWSDPAFVLPLLWPMYLLHQFEEHGVDCMGRQFAFLSDLCTALGRPDLATCPADADFVFSVNVVGCPFAFVLPLVFRRRRPLLAAFGWSIPMVNALAHIGAGVAHDAYNAGLLTSVLLFLPLSAWMVRVMLRSGNMTLSQLPFLLASGVALHGVLIGSVLLRERELISHGALLIINALNGLLPFAVGVLVASLSRTEPAHRPA